MTRRLIPERTVDSLLAIEVATFIPTALIWSPTNTAGQIDHEIPLTNGRVLSFECKGIISNPARDPGSRWSAPIDYPQLAAYLGGPLPILYVIAAKPPNPQFPWLREPCSDPDPLNHCKACSNHLSPARRSAGASPLVASAPIHLRLQPWFAHWCWVIPAAALDQHLAAVGRPLDLPCADADLAPIAGSDRLCHLLRDVEAGDPSIDRFSIAAEVLPGVLADWPALRAVSTAGDDPEGTPLQFISINQ